MPSILHIQAIIMHINELAVEILGEIFMQCLEPPVPTMTGPQLVSSHNTLVLITHICTHWRTVALSITSLWEDIVVDGSTGQRGAVDPWITRAGTQPLFIQADMAGPGKQDPSIKTIIHHFDRCQFFRSDWSIRLWHEILSRHPNLPNLRTLNMVMLYASLAQISDILQVTPNLERFALTTGMWTVTGYQGPILALNHLKALRVMLPNYSADLFHNLSLPSLQHILVSVAPRAPSAWVHSAFTGLIRRSGCSLISLTLVLSATNVEYTEMLELLHLCPRLERLQLDDCATSGWIDGRIFERLKFTSVNSHSRQLILLPGLSNLKLDLSGPVWHQFDHDPLVSMLNSRWMEGSDALEFVTLKMRPDKLTPSSSLLVALRELWEGSV